MAVRILLILIAILLIANLVILLTGYLFKVNMYKEHGRFLLIALCSFVLLIVAAYVVLALLGLV
ncbi:MAG: hypothetical protein MJ180_05195 [Candidatus Gastranaerophilales bacterium]|nr:hypothetical protein [Candidatus Gastranaerophilales bacterium]